MYCINCGAKLADSEKTCPLCLTPVYSPYVKTENTEKGYPRYERSTEVNRSGIMFIISVIFALPILLTIICDFSVNGKIVWSGFAALSLLLSYVIIILPIWFNKANPVIFVPVDFAAAALFLWYVCFAVKGDWFFKFALPETLALCIIVTAVITLRKYVKKGALYVFGGALISLGFYTVMTEMLINIVFLKKIGLVWSYYPLITFFILGMMLIVIAICKPLKNSLKKKFFV